MTMSNAQPQVTTTDLLLLIGRKEVEIAFLRQRIAELEARPAQADTSPNGVQMTESVRSPLA